MRLNSANLIFLPSNNTLSTVCAEMFCWSKNVMQELDMPTKLLLGAKDQEYCVFTAMGAWLEINFDLDNNNFYLSFQCYNSPQTIKNCILMLWG